MVWNPKGGVVPSEVSKKTLGYQILLLIMLLLVVQVATAVTPRVDEIKRKNPIADVTNANLVEFQVVFTEEVTGVDVTDFVLSSTVAGANISQVLGSGTTWTVEVNTGSTGEGTLKLKLVDDNSIKDISDGDPLGGSSSGDGNYDNGQSYLIDRTPPTVTITSQPVIITSQPTPTPQTTIASATFEFQGSDDVGTVTFECQLDSGGFTPCGSSCSSTTPCSSSYSNLGEGDHSFKIRFTDEAGNGDEWEYSWTITAPTIAPPPTLTISPPSVTKVISGVGNSVNYSVTYSDATTVNLTANKITLNKTGTATGDINVTDGTTDNPTVTITNVKGEGTLGITIQAGTATNSDGEQAGEQGPSQIFEVEAATLPDSRFPPDDPLPSDDDPSQEESTDSTSNLQPLPPVMNLTVKVSGRGLGRVESDPIGIDCNNDDEKCQYQFDTASWVTLKPIPAAGSQFLAWGGPSECNDGRLFMSQHFSCTAYFIEEKSLLTSILTVTTTGNGFVSSTPSGIACGSGSDQCSYTFESDKTIVLTAFPERGWQFEGWQRDCDDNGRVTMTTDKQCQAFFVPAPVALPVLPPVTEPQENLTPVEETVPERTPISEDVPTTTPSDASTPAEPTTPPVGSTPVEEPPVSTTIISNEVPLCLTTTAVPIDWVCNAQGRELVNLTVGSKGDVSNGVVVDAVDNYGWLSNIFVEPQASVNGGIITGWVVNEGLMANFEFRGAALIGGLLAGNIFNNSQVRGYFKDVHLAAGTVITGGYLVGQVIGEADAPAQLENVTFMSDTYLENVNLGENVKFLSENITFGPGVQMVTPPLVVAEEATVENPLENLKPDCIANALGINVNGHLVEGNQTCFTDTISTDRGIQPHHRMIAYNDTVKVSATITPDPKHLGKPGNLYLVAVHDTLLPPNRYMRVGEIWEPWDGKLNNLQSAASFAQLPETIEIIAYEGQLSPGEITLFVGYRPSEEDTFFYNGKDPIHFYVGNATTLNMESNLRLGYSREYATSYFESYLYNYEGHFENNRALIFSDPLNVSTFMRVDSPHVGQPAAFFIVAIHQPHQGQSVTYTHAGDQWQPWDGQWRSLKPLLSYDELPARLEVSVELNSLKVTQGELMIYMGYQLDENDVLVFNELYPFHVTIVDDTTN